MYNTKKVLNNDLDTIINKIGEYGIYQHYIGDFKVNTIFNSPLRKDNNPSFGIFVSKSTGKLLFKDLATGETGNCIKFVKILYNYNTYADTIEQLKKDFNNNTVDNISRKSYIKTQTVRKTVQIIKRAFTQADLNYWNSYCITRDTLIKFKVNAITHVFINGVVYYTYMTTEPMYSYTVFSSYKIYRPLSNKLNKWLGNTTAYDIQGFEQLPETGDLLIITKSLKDVMALYELGFTAIAPNSESTVIPSTIMTDLKKRFKQIILFYDRDLGGLNGTRVMMKLYDLPFIFLDKTLPKDVSDLIKNTNKKIAYEIVKSKIVSRGCL